MWIRFWTWYERNYTLNVSFALALFVLQIGHLVWLSGEVVAGRILGTPLFTLDGAPQLLIILVDYTEIPAIFAMSLVYLDAWRRGERARSALMLFLLHIQWLHLFWITDAFVLETFNSDSAGDTVLSPLLAWVAILIDYAEVPVIVDTVIRLVRAVRAYGNLEDVSTVFRA